MRDPGLERSLTFIEHLVELRKRIIVSLIGVLLGAVIVFFLFDSIVTFLLTPFKLLEVGAEGQRLFINTLFEGFLTKLKISLLIGIIVSLPVHLYNAIRFIFPGLTMREKKAIIIALVVSFTLVVFSFYYSYYKIIPISVRFLTSSSFIPVNVGLLLNYNKNIFYILQFILVTLIIFQMPIILEILLVMNIVKRKALLRMSKYIIVSIFVLSALLTPPDFVSQISLAAPLIILYFFVILIAKIFKFGEE
jgi:sec-independent protein translocase protein TatC